MYVAEKLRKENIGEYLLYMWQVEDVVRAYGMDAERIGTEYVPRFGLDEEKSETMRGWYGQMVEMMREEGVAEKGHLQVNKNILILLADLHAQLLRSSKHPFYSAAYYKALPFIVELRSKSEESQKKNEIENCFDALYGVMLLRMQGKEVSAETATAIGHIAKFIGMLSEYYKKDKAGEVEY